jgi:hypothetical protein
MKRLEWVSDGLGAIFSSLRKVSGAPGRTASEALAVKCIIPTSRTYKSLKRFWSIDLADACQP